MLYINACIFNQKKNYFHIITPTQNEYKNQKIILSFQVQLIFV